MRDVFDLMCDVFRRRRSCDVQAEAGVEGEGLTDGQLGHNPVVSLGCQQFWR